MVAGPSALPVVSDAPQVGRMIVSGIVLATIGFGGFGGWAAMAPLASAAVASGTVTADSNRKTIQHLDGGIITEILVHDGDQVTGGQVLVRLDDLETRSVAAVLDGQYIALRAQEARLMAERDSQTAINWPPALAARHGEDGVTDVLTGQQRIFSTRKTGLEESIAVIRQRIAQSDAEIAALDAQLNAGRRQSTLIAEEIAGVEEMVAKGLERRPRLLALMRQAVQLEGAQGDLANRIAQSRKAIAQAEQEILALHANRQSEIASELREVQTQRAETEEKLAAAKARQKRQDVIAPETGTVMNLRFFAPGAVVTSGTPILDLVPLEDRLVIDARLNPSDIDVVHVGLPARVTLTAYHSRTTPRLDGSVTRVSADALRDERNGTSYYQARIEVDAAQLENLRNVRLQSGMPADVLIETGDRTLLRYLLQPIEDSFRKAFRED
jgi:HlyD family type I secretion membrane fusion protein